MNRLTQQQQEAVTATGNVLVLAGAGTGKTRTVVERCVDRVCAAANPISLDRVLMVTFTEAAAAEMRRRVRGRLEERAGADGLDPRLSEQLALVDSAWICTLHSFCLHLIREHFDALSLDPEMSVLTEAQARLLAHDALDDLLEQAYAGAAGADDGFRQLVLRYGRGGDQLIRGLLLELHSYTQTLRNPDQWFESEIARLRQPYPHHWMDWLRRAAVDLRRRWIPLLAQQPPATPNLSECAEALEAIGDEPTRDQLARTLGQLVELGGKERWPHGSGKLRQPLEPLFEDAAFLRSLAVAGEAVDPLAEDWEWVRGPMLALIELARRFGSRFARAKRESGAVDFHDLEQYALALLWDREANAPSAVARAWRNRLDLVFVDEYQDINDAQDAILQALGRDGGAANRFLVGDIKQSIYRFRLANPRIFQRYAELWAGAAGIGRVIPLSDNFRSHPDILELANRFFAALMHREAGGVQFDDTQRLAFGEPDTRNHWRLERDPAPRVELHLLRVGDPAEDPEESEADDAVADLNRIELEAWIVGERLRRLRSGAFRTWDTARAEFRPLEWRDMAILLRSPRGKAEAYAKVFERLGIPLEVERGGFLESPEITDLLGVLQLLDNPLQDLPLIAVLRSPLVGLSVDELAAIRLARPSGAFWFALREAQEHATPKVARFLESLRRWRRLAREGALSACLEAILDDTAYEAWLAAQSRAAQRLGNVRRLLVLSRQFDQFQRQGLFRFLRYVESQVEAGLELEPAAAAAVDTVRLMSIHRSKGLEFPVVAVADLGKAFNLSDLRRPMILDEDLGLCPRVRPPHAGRAYPSLAHWLAAQHQRAETLGEEIRLLYVACTRACDLLVLSGAASEKNLETEWTVMPEEAAWPTYTLGARCPLAWLMPWLRQYSGNSDWTRDGRVSGIAWYVHSPASIRASDLPETRLPQTAAVASRPVASDEDFAALEARLRWQYPDAALALDPAKSSVSALRRRWRDEMDQESPLLVRRWGEATLGPSLRVARRLGDPGPEATETGLSPAEVGTAHHLFLERLPLNIDPSREVLEAEGRRLVAAGVMTELELASLDLEAIAHFWMTDLGRAVRAQAAEVHRELPFTARLSLADLERLEISASAGASETEFIVVQGIVDLAILRESDMVIIDFKTDKVQAGQLAEHAAAYRPQLQLYALALSRIYRRPVRGLWLHFLEARASVAVPLMGS